MAAFDIVASKGLKRRGLVNIPNSNASVVRAAHKQIGQQRVEKDVVNAVRVPSEHADCVRLIRCDVKEPNFKIFASCQKLSRPHLAPNDSEDRLWMRVPAFNFEGFEAFIDCEHHSFVVLR